MIHWNSTSYQYLVPLTDVYLSLDGTVIPNHGYLEISDIGSISDNEALLCHTNNPPPPPSTNSGGEWYASNGDRVGGTPAVPGFTRNRGAMVVRSVVHHWREYIDVKLKMQMKLFKQCMWDCTMLEQVE